VSITASGHVVIAGRDSLIKVQTGGDVAQHTHQTVTVGGVETSPQELEIMLQCFREFGETIQSQRQLPAGAREAAMHDLNTFEQQLTAKKTPNIHILKRAAKSLLRLSLRFSPALIAAAFSLFDQPLVGAIMSSTGEAGVKLYETIMRHHPDKK